MITALQLQKALQARTDAESSLEGLEGIEVVFVGLDAEYAYFKVSTRNKVKYAASVDYLKNKTRLAITKEKLIGAYAYIAECKIAAI